MANTKRLIELLVKADTADAGGKIDGIVKKLTGLDLKHAALATGVAAAGAVIIKTYDALVDGAAEFEKSLAEINTLLDANDKTMGALKGNLSEASVEFGQMNTVLARAQYNIISAGFSDMAESALLLETAGKAATAGLTDINTSARTITSILNAYGLAASEAGSISDLLFTTVREGVTTFPELSASIGNVISTASVAGVEFEEVAAAIAAMTKSGISSHEAVTALNNLIISISAPVGDTAEKIDELGLSLEGGLAGALVTLGKVSEGGLGPLREIIPNIRALKAAAAAGKDGAREFTSILGEMTKSAGATDTAYSHMSKTLDFATGRASSAWDALKDAIGSTGLEGKTDLMNSIADAVSELADSVGENEEALKTFAGVMYKLASLPVDGVANTIKLLDYLREHNVIPPSYSEAMQALRDDIDYMTEVGTKLGLDYDNRPDQGPVGRGLPLPEYDADAIFGNLADRSEAAEQSKKDLGERTAALEKVDATLAKINEKLLKMQEESGKFLPPEPVLSSMDEEIQDSLLDFEGDGIDIDIVDSDLQQAAESAALFKQEMNAALRDGISEFANLGAAGITTLAGLRQGTVSFADTMKSVLASAIEAVISKFIRLKVMTAVFRLFGLSEGGVPAMANGGVIGMAGGGILQAAEGMVVPDAGARGRDSVLAMLQPQEGVVRRDTMVRLDNMLESWERSAFISPGEIPGGGGGRGDVHVHYNIARPISLSDHVEAGRNAAEAADRYAKEFI